MEALEEVSLGRRDQTCEAGSASQNLCCFREALVCHFLCSSRRQEPLHLGEKRCSRAPEATKRLGPLARHTIHVFQPGSHEAESSTCARSPPRHLRSPIGAPRMRAVEREAGLPQGRSHYRRRRLISLQVDADVVDVVARCRLPHKPDVLFASLKALDST